LSKKANSGLKILGATLTPFYGAAYYTEVGETKRQALNQWIRTGKAYDAVIDFDKATRDPDNPRCFCRYTSPATTSIQATPGTKRWPTPSTSPYRALRTANPRRCNILRAAICWSQAG
jgi:hypothetical protein